MNTGEKSLKDVMNEISTLKARYYELGRDLGVPVHELDTLKKQYGAANFDQAFNDVVLLWLRGHSTRTWQALVRAVDKFNHDLAMEIAGHHRAKSKLVMIIIMPTLISYNCIYILWPLPLINVIVIIILYSKNCERDKSGLIREGHP